MQRAILTLSIIFVQIIFGQTKYDVIIKNANIIHLAKNDVKPNQNLGIIGGKIAVIENNKKSKLRGKKTIDLKGQYIMASLADAHVHFPATEIEMEKMLQLYILNGVTKLRSMRGEWKHKEWKDKFNTINSYYPKLYLSAPPITGNMDATAEIFDKFVEGAKNNDFKFIKILGLKNEIIFKRLDSICKKYDMPIAGHFPSTKASISDEIIFNSNYTSIEHLGGLAGEPATLMSRLSSFKMHNIILCPTLSWYDIGSGRYTYEELKQQAGLAFIPKATVDSWFAKTKDYREKIGAEAYKKEVTDELKSLDEKFEIINKANQLGIKMLLSPDSSSYFIVPGFSVLSEMKLLKNAKLQNAEILEMATSNFSDFFKENYGELAVGKDADFIVLKENPLNNLDALKEIKGIYYNSIYLSFQDLKKIKQRLMKEVKN